MQDRDLGRAFVAVAWAVFVGAAAVAMAAGLRVLLGLVLPTDLSFTAMLPAVVVAALAGGLGAGVVAAVLGGIVAQWAFVEPYYLFAVPTFKDVGNLVAYAILCVLVLWATGVYDRARRRAEANAAAAARLVSVVTNSVDAIVGFDRNGMVEDWNAAAERLFGCTADEIVGRPASILFEDDDGRGGTRKLLAREPARFTTRGITKDGRRVEVAVTTGPVHLADGTWIGVAAIVRDIGSEVAAERALREANRHNIALLSESHQRMRDMLQMVCGLVQACGRAAEPDPARGPIVALERRIGVVMRIHDQLHRAAEHGTVEIGAALRQLIGDMVGVAGRPVDMEIFGTSEVRLASDVALAVVFAVTELVTNAVTHAGGQRPTVRVRCSREEGALVVVVADDGHGLPAGFELGRARGLGLRMAESAVERLGGTLRQLPQDAGAAFEIRVPVEA